MWKVVGVVLLLLLMGHAPRVGLAQRLVGNPMHPLTIPPVQEVAPADHGTPSPVASARLATTPTATPTPLPDKVLITAVPHGRQLQNLSCESRSAVDLAAFWGVKIGEKAFFNALPKSDNPHKGFVGKVTAPPGSLPPLGYGVYAEPVAATLQRFGLDARPRYRLGLDGLRAELAAGRPVLVWITYELRFYPTQTWVSRDGDTSAIVPYEHTGVVIGYQSAPATDQGVFVTDPWDGQIKFYPYDAFEASWSRFDQMAVTVRGRLPFARATVSAEGRWLRHYEPE